MTITIEAIKARCDEWGDCWLWRDATNSRGYPIIHVGDTCTTVRRMMAVLAGKPPAHRQPVITTCEEKRCCNPEHIKLSSFHEVHKIAAKNGSYSSVAFCAGRAASARKRSETKITKQQAHDIRLSEKSSVALSAEYGVVRSQISAIKRGEAWKEYSNPFSGLGARR